MSLKNKILAFTIAVSAAILGGFLFGKGCFRSKPVTATPAVLKADEKEQILIDPTRHTITIVTPEGITRKTLTDNPSTVILRKNGDVVVNVPQFGFQHRPFIGVGFSEKWRFVGGCDLLFFKHLDLGPALSFEPMQVFESARVNLVLSYNVWSNTRVGIAIDHTGQFAGFVSVRL